MRFAAYFKWVYFFYGIVITVVPMVVGYLFSKYVLKLSLLNNLGSIAGGHDVHAGTRLAHRRGGNG